MDRPARILFVEDEDSLREVVAGFLRRAGHSVRCAEDGPTGVAIFEAEGADLVVSDVRLPGFSGIEVCRRVREIEPRQRLLIATAVLSDEDRQELEMLGGVGVLTKPYMPDELLAKIAAALPGGVLDSGLPPPV